MYPIDNEHGDIPGSYVSLPEGQQHLELEPFTEPKEIQLITTWDGAWHPVNNGR